MNPVPAGLVPNSGGVSSREHLISVDDASSEVTDTSTATTTTPRLALVGRNFSKNLVANLCDRHRDTSLTETGKREQCHHCKYFRIMPYTDNKGKSRDIFYRHMIDMHIDKIFAEAKSQSDSHEQFLLKCNEVIRVAIERCRVPGSGQGTVTSVYLGSKNSPCLCVWCNRRFQGEPNFRYHFVVEHYHIFEEMLIPNYRRTIKDQGGKTITGDNDYQILKTDNTSIEEKTNRSTNPNQAIQTECLKDKFQREQNPETNNVVSSEAINNASSGTCDVGENGECAQKFNSNTTLQSQQQESCPPSTINVGWTWTCNSVEGGCGNTFQTEHSLRSHKRDYCTKLATRKRNTFVPCDIKGNGGCGRKFDTFNSMMRHKLESCPLRKIKTWLCDPVDGGCGKSFEVKASLRGHKLYHCRFRKNRTFWICKVEEGGCGTKCCTPQILRDHQRLTCPCINRQPPVVTIDDDDDDVTTTDDIEDGAQHSPCVQEEGAEIGTMSWNSAESEQRITVNVGNFGDPLGDTDTISPVNNHSLEFPVVGTKAQVKNEDVDGTEGTVIFPD